MFRHERPQKGRYRQFHQLDVEALGYPGPDVDAELILMAPRAVARAGPVEGEHVRLEINSLGEPDERQRASRRAGRALRAARATCSMPTRSAACTRTRCASSTPRTPRCRRWSKARRKLIDFLGEDVAARTSTPCARCSKPRGMPYRINPRLVRGLDYYNRTVFEWITDQLGAQGTICGGGRYDGLIEQLGGKPTPAVGFGLGIERVLLLLKELGVRGAGAAPRRVRHRSRCRRRCRWPCAALRGAARGRRVACRCTRSADGMGSMKSQFKKADASGARYALIFGADELAQRRGRR